MNDGEDNVFPIQVSLQELLLFLRCYYFYRQYQNIVLFLCPKR
jgi:hypothetical protein